MADESAFSMKLKGDEAQGNYVDIDYTFAVAMVGQICELHLISQYIGQLVEVFKLQPTPEEKKPEENGDQPKTPEQLPEQEAQN